MQASGSALKQEMPISMPPSSGTSSPRPSTPTSPQVDRSCFISTPQSYAPQQNVNFPPASGTFGAPSYIQQQPTPMTDSTTSFFQSTFATKHFLYLLGQLEIYRIRLDCYRRGFDKAYEKKSQLSKSLQAKQEEHNRLKQK